MENTIRNCGYAHSNIKDNFIMGKYFIEIYNSEKVDIISLCNKIGDVAKYISMCNSSANIGDKISIKFGSVKYDDTNISLASQEKAKFYLINFPNIKETQELYDSLDTSDFSPSEKRIFEFNKNILNEILDNPLFIDAIYKYLWSCIYAYAIKTLWLDDFISFVVENINSKTRENYIICNCDNRLKKMPISSLINGNVSSQNLYEYTCGRALGKITEPNRITRFVIYNTISDRNDYMDENYFESIKPTITGGKSKKYRSRKRKSRKRKYKSSRKYK